MIEPSDYIAIEHHNGQYMLSYTVDKEVHGDTDKTKIREILLSVIDNFNKANPHYAIVHIPRPKMIKT